MDGSMALMLKDACASGDVRAARAALEAAGSGGGKLADADVFLAFRTACENGHLAVARWLHEDVGGVDVHARDDVVFQAACNVGHLDVARWLYKDVGGVDAHACHDEAFRTACINGHLAVARWLHEDGGGVDVHVRAEEAFRRACGNGHLAVAVWLHDVVGGVNIHADDDTAFQWACRGKGHPAVALWLDSDAVWSGGGGGGGRWEKPKWKPAWCVAYVQAARWSALRAQWVGMVASFGGRAGGGRGPLRCGR